MRAEVVLAIRDEQGQTLADVLVRRVVVGWQADLGRSCAPAIAQAMADELGWNQERIDRELEDFENYLHRFTVLDTQVSA